MSDFSLDSFDPLTGATQATIREYMRKKHARILGAIDEVAVAPSEASDTPEPPAPAEQPTQQQRVRQAIMARQQAAPATRKGPDMGEAPSVPVEVGMWSAAQPGLMAGRNAMLAAAGVEATARPSDVAGRVLDEKSKVAEYVARKRGLALAEQNADNTAERTAAYSEATKANAERAQAQLEASQAKAALDAELRRRNVDLEEAKVAETSRHNKSIEEVTRRRHVGAVGGVGDGKQLPTAQLSELGDIDTAQAGLGDLLNTFKTKDMGGLTRRIEGMVTPEGLNTNVNEYRDKVRATAQAVGTILEGGKLAAGDELKYARMMPQAGDSPERAAEKIENLRKLLEQTKTNRVAKFKEGGYRTPASSSAPGADTATPAPEPSGGLVDVIMADGSRSKVSKRSADLLIKHGKAKLP